MTFNESAMLSPTKEQLHAQNDSGVRENVEFVPKASDTIEKKDFNKAKGGRNATPL